MKHFDEFVECAELIKEKLNTNRVSFSTVLTYMKKLPEFDYKAIRAWPHPYTIEQTIIKFPGDKLALSKTDKIQICFFDKTLLKNPYKIVEKKTFAANQTI